MNDYRTFQGGDDIVMGVLCILCCIMFLIVCSFGCCAACCRNWCCGIVLSFFSFVFAILLLAVAEILYTQGDYLQDLVCEGEIKDTIRTYYNEFVDAHMCSEACPCVF